MARSAIILWTVLLLGYAFFRLVAARRPGVPGFMKGPWDTPLLFALTGICAAWLAWDFGEPRPRPLSEAGVEQDESR